MNTIEKKYNTFLPIFGIGLLGFYFLSKKKKTENPTQTEESSDASFPITEKPTIDQEIILKAGSRGKEVEKLQSLMAITADGIFGPATQAQLYKLKGVIQTTLKQFFSSPTINQNILKPGTNVMAKIKTGTRIFDAQPKADTSYFTNYKVVKTIPYGQEIGKIRSANPAGNWYAVYYSDGFIYGTKVGFVLATDVEKF